VLTALHREPGRRYRSAAALADDLANFLAKRPIRARPDTLHYRLRKFAGRNRLPLAAATLGLLALLAGLGIALWQAQEARLAARRADAEARRAERVKSFLLSIFRQSDPDASGGAAVTARELLERGTQRIGVELAGEPVTQAEMLDAVARIEGNLALTGPGLEHARRALELREAVLPRGDARTAESRVLLGDLQRAHGDLDPARRTLERALAETYAARGPGSLEVAMARRSLAGSLSRPEDRGRAVDLLRQALAVVRQRLGDGHVETALTLSELGYALEQDGRYPEADRTYRLALKRLEGVFGPRHPKVAKVQVDLAGLLDRLSRPAEARALLERAIATQRATLGPRHTDLAEALFSYGLMLMGEQEYPSADVALREALGIFGPDRFEAAHCLRYLGLSALDQERYPEAVDLLSRADAAYARTMGPDDLQRWRTIANLGWAHLKMGQPQRARRELAGAVARIERLAGPEGYELRQPLRQLGEAMTAVGDTAGAIATLERTRHLEETLFGTLRHAEIASTDLLLAQAWLARGAAGDRRTARGVLDESLGILSSLGTKDLIHGKVLLESGRLALAEGDRPRARRDLAAAEPLLLERLAPRHPLLRELRRLRARAGGYILAGTSIPSRSSTRSRVVATARVSQR
jgi:tetratricopeptide (TPR) repeat protein